MMLGRQDKDLVIFFLFLSFFFFFFFFSFFFLLFFTPSFHALHSLPAAPAPEIQLEFFIEEAGIRIFVKVPRLDFDLVTKNLKVKCSNLLGRHVGVVHIRLEEPGAAPRAILDADDLADALKGKAEFKVKTPQSSGATATSASTSASPVRFEGNSQGAELGKFTPFHQKSWLETLMSKAPADLVKTKDLLVKLRHILELRPIAQDVISLVIAVFSRPEILECMLETEVKRILDLFFDSSFLTDLRNFSAFLKARLATLKRGIDVEDRRATEELNNAARLVRSLLQRSPRSVGIFREGKDRAASFKSPSLTLFPFASIRGDP